MLKNKKHEQFCIEYIKDMNATRAYMRVYKCEEESARKNGSRLMTNDDVLRRIKELQGKCEEKSVFGVQDVINGLIRNYQIASGQIPIQRPDPLTGEMKETYITELGNANKALELLGKQFGMYVTKVDVNANIEGGVVIKNDIPRGKS